jgi:hypothetical protein
MRSRWMGEGIFRSPVDADGRVNRRTSVQKTRRRPARELAMKPTHESRPLRPEASGIRVLDTAYAAELLVPGTPLRGCCGIAFHDDGGILVGNVLSGRISRLALSTGGVSIHVDFHVGVLGVDDITSDGHGTCWTSFPTGFGGESVFRIEKSAPMVMISTWGDGASVWLRFFWTLLALQTASASLMSDAEPGV